VPLKILAKSAPRWF